MRLSIWKDCLGVVGVVVDIKDFGHSVLHIMHIEILSRHHTWPHSSVKSYLTQKETSHGTQWSMVLRGKMKHRPPRVPPHLRSLPSPPVGSATYRSSPESGED